MLHGAPHARLSLVDGIGRGKGIMKWAARTESAQHDVRPSHRLFACRVSRSSALIRAQGTGRTRILAKIAQSELFFEKVSWKSACERAPKRFYTLFRASLLSHSGLASWLLNWLAKGLYSLMSDFRKDPGLTSLHSAM